MCFKCSETISIAQNHYYQIKKSCKNRNNAKNDLLKSRNNSQKKNNFNRLNTNILTI